MHQEEQEVPTASAYRERIESQLPNWEVQSIEASTSDSAFGCECVARYGERLEVRITRDRGTDTLLVGTEAPNDLFPLEDVAVCLGALEPDHLYPTIPLDASDAPSDPPLSFTEALRFLSHEAERLDTKFSHRDQEFRQDLRKVSDQFNRAWDMAIERQKPDLGLSR